MKILRLVQKNYAILGISPSHNSNQRSRFNGRVLFGFSLFGCVVVFQLVFMFHMDGGLMEYMDAICSISATILMFICFVAIVLKETTLFESIDSIEKLIDTSEPIQTVLIINSNTKFTICCILQEINIRVFTVVMKIAVQIVVLPKCFVSFVVYFGTDAGSDSFQLPYPIW